MNSAGWEHIWTSDRIPAAYASFAPPNDTVVEWGKHLPAGAAVFDLGCGVGRHVLYLGGCGFRMAGADVSPAGVQQTTALAAERGIAFDGRVCVMTELPWPDASFDAALSTSTIHHGLRADVQRAIAEVRRVLKPGGTFLVDFPSTEREDLTQLRADAAAGQIREVEPNTFIDDRPNSEDADGFLPHHYVDEADVRDLLRDFSIERLEQEPNRRRWVAWARKPA
jgi:SAM-dependent methyltransferase